MRRMCLVLVAILASPASAQPAPAKHAKRRVAAFSGHNAAKTSLRTTPLDKPSGHIKLRAENLAEEVEVDIYKADGSFDENALAKLDELFRDPRVGECRA